MVQDTYRDMFKREMAKVNLQYPSSASEEAKAIIKAVTRDPVGVAAAAAGAAAV